jgi:sugar lactone lactonase YvrE
MRALRGISLAAAVLGALALSAAPPAGAKLVAAKLPFSLGPIGRPNAVSIDQATGDVYVTDHATGKVMVFGSEGDTPSAGVPTEVTGGETPSGAFNLLGPSEPAGVAVGASGDLYVADVGNKVVDKFKLEGGAYKYVCQFAGFGNTGNGCLPNLTTHETNPSKPFTGPGGIAIDAHGNVYVSDFGGTVGEFNAAGEDVRQVAIPSGEPSGLAVDSNGILYVQDYQGPVYKLTPHGATEFEVAEVDSERSLAVAVDPTINDVYVDHNEFIVIREPPEGIAPGALIAELKPVGSFSSEGVAVNGATHDLYAANSLTESIEVFKFVKVPDVRLSGEATEVTPTTATLHGEIDPEETSEAKYYFEYGTGSAFTSSTTPTSAGAGNAFVPATAELSGLLPGTTYNYRLVATNSSGLTNVSEEGTVTTSNARPEVSEVEATEITPNSAILRGEVNPKSDPTTIRFEYGETESYGERLPEVAIATASTNIPVEEVTSTELKPNHTYHFRLVAINSAGETPSTDETFHTPSNGTPPEMPPVVSTTGAESITPNSATLTATVYPEDTPTSYFFEFGSDTNYGTAIYGGEAGRERGSSLVSQAVAGLQPGVTYHYRVVAFNAAGSTTGVDRSFTTPNPPTGILQPATPQLLAIPVFPPVKIPVPKPPKHKKKHSKAKRKAHKASRIRAHTRRRT